MICDMWCVNVYNVYWCMTYDVDDVYEVYDILMELDMITL